MFSTRMPSLKTSIFVFLSLIALNSNATLVSDSLPVAGNAVYDSIMPDSFMTRWLLLGPIPAGGPDEMVGEAEQKAFFETLYFREKDIQSIEAGDMQKIEGEKMGWQFYESPEHAVDLQQAMGEHNFTSAYAWAEIETDEEREWLFGLGSDDAVRVWLNGELVHDHWIGRPMLKDDDLLALQLKAGTNTILLKIHNMEYGWEFSFRPLGQASLDDLLNKASLQGDLETMEEVLRFGANPDAINNNGLTAYQVAQIKGRNQAMDILEKAGADLSLPMPSPESVLDSVLGRASRGFAPATSVLVSRGGDILYQKAFGHACLEHEVQATPETKFRIGSVTKQFTAAAILKLQEAGKLSVQDSLSKYIPDYPRGNEVSIHHLLTHTSGIPNYTDDVVFTENMRNYSSLEDLLETFKDKDFLFDPGTEWRYCNSGYILLQYIIEEVSGKSYADYLQEALFDPIGMEHTGVHDYYTILENEAFGYSYIEGELMRSENWDMSHAGGAGAIYSTTGDLYLWNEAVFKGDILSEESKRAAFNPVTLNNEEVAQTLLSEYGYGWGMMDYRGRELVLHSGGLHGFVSMLARDVEDELTIAALCNSMPSYKVDPQGILMLALELYEWENMDQQESFALATDIDPEIYDDYTGLYEFPYGMLLTVSREEDRLFAQMSGQSRFEIFPKEKDQFFWKVVDAQIEFVRDDQGEVTHAIHRQAGMENKVPKIEEEEAIEMDPALYDQFTGVYEIMEGVNIAITKEADRIYARITGQNRFEIFPRSENVFFFKMVKADLSFHKNDEGKVEKLTLTQAGIQREAIKIE